MNGNSNIVHVTRDDFEDVVINSDKLVLIDFYASWCGPCQRLSNIIEEISKERNDIKIVKIDVDDASDLAEKYSVRSIPTLVIMEKGKEINRSVGMLPKTQILDFIDNK